MQEKSVVHVIAPVVKLGFNGAAVTFEVVGHLLAYMPVHVLVAGRVHNVVLGLGAGLPGLTLAAKGVLAELLGQFLADGRLRIERVGRQNEVDGTVTVSVHDSHVISA